MGPGLGGTGRVADDLHLLAHSDVTGKPYIQPRPLGLGLAGALLAELVLDGAISVHEDQIIVVGGRRPRGGELTAHVLGLVVRERETHPLRDWLAYVARTAPADVARRLEAAGYLTPAGRWLPWRPGRWVPVDSDSAFAPMLTVRAALDASRPLAIYDAMLAGLADACGLGFRLALYTPARFVRPVHDAVAQLPCSLYDLVVHTRAAVDSAVLAHRL